MRSAVLAWLIATSPLASVRNSPEVQGASRKGWAIPFENHDGLVIVKARVNGGRTRRFVVDTGARPCVIDISVARSQAVSDGAPVQAVGGGGKFYARGARGATITVDGRIIRCNGIWVTDLSLVSASVGTRIDGLIGSGLFEDATVTLDYPRRTLTVAPTSEAPYRGSGTVIPILIRSSRPYVQAVLRVAGQPERPSRLLIDTGSQDEVDDSLIAKAASDSGTKLRTSGLGPGAATVGGTFEEVRIGALTFKHVRGVLPAVPIIGAGLLSRFRVTLNYKAGWMALEGR